MLDQVNSLQSKSFKHDRFSPGDDFENSPRGHLNDTAVTGIYPFRKERVEEDEYISDTSRGRDLCVPSVSSRRGKMDSVVPVFVNDVNDDIELVLLGRPEDSISRTFTIAGGKLEEVPLVAAMHMILCAALILVGVTSVLVYITRASYSDLYASSELATTTTTTTTTTTGDPQRNGPSNEDFVREGTPAASARALAGMLDRQLYNALVPLHIQMAHRITFLLGVPSIILGTVGLWVNRPHRKKGTLVLAFFLFFLAFASFLFLFRTFSANISYSSANFDDYSSAEEDGDIPAISIQSAVAELWMRLYRSSIPKRQEQWCSVEEIFGCSGLSTCCHTNTTLVDDSALADPTHPIWQKVCYITLGNRNCVNAQGDDVTSAVSAQCRFDVCQSDTVEEDVHLGSLVTPDISTFTHNGGAVMVRGWGPVHSAACAWRVPAMVESRFAVSVCLMMSTCIFALTASALSFCLALFR